jgi:putative transposase
MSQRTLLLKSTGEYFHVYNRGVNRGQIFFSHQDYLRFMKLMKISLIKEQLSLHAYSLMPNHYHMILLQLAPGAMSGYIKRVCESYAEETNRRNGRTGHLFQGRYRIRAIDGMSALVYVSRYIHRNPVRAGLVSLAEEWEYSSCRAYYGDVGSGFLTTEPILRLAGGVEAYRNYVTHEPERNGEDMERYLIDRDLS